MDLRFYERTRPEAILSAYEHDFKKNKIMQVLIVFFQTGEYSRCFRIIGKFDRKGRQETLEFGYTTDDDLIEDGFELDEEHLYVAHYFMYDDKMSFLENLEAAITNDDTKIEQADADFIKRMFVLKEGAEDESDS